MGGVSSTITQATYASTDELFTDNTFYVCICPSSGLLPYSAHKKEAEDEENEAI